MERLTSVKYYNTRYRVFNYEIVVILFYGSSPYLMWLIEELLWEGKIQQQSLASNLSSRKYMTDSRELLTYGIVFSVHKNIKIAPKHFRQRIVRKMLYTENNPNISNRFDNSSIFVKVGKRVYRDVEILV